MKDAFSAYKSRLGTHVYLIIPPLQKLFVPAGFLFLTLLITSCSTTSSIPTVLNVPMFQKGRETHVGAYVGSDHSEVQAARSFDTIRGVILNGYVGYKNFLESGKDTVRNWAFTVEGGYCYSKRFSGKTKMEFIGGYGFGRKKYYEHYARKCGIICAVDEPKRSEVLYSIDNSFHRLFAQVNWGIKTGKKAESKSMFSLSLRASALFYPQYKIQYEKYDLDKSYFIPIKADSFSLRNEVTLQFEPALSVRFGLSRPAYLVCQISPCLPMVGSSLIEKYSAPFPLAIGFGLYIAMDGKKK